MSSRCLIHTQPWLLSVGRGLPEEPYCLVWWEADRYNRLAVPPETGSVSAAAAKGSRGQPAPRVCILQVDSQLLKRKAQKTDGQPGDTPSGRSRTDRAGQLEQAVGDLPQHEPKPGSVCLGWTCLEATAGRRGGSAAAGGDVPGPGARTEAAAGKGG